MSEKIEKIIAKASRRHVVDEIGVGRRRHSYVDDYSEAAAEIDKLWEEERAESHRQIRNWLHTIDGLQADLADAKMTIGVLDRAVEVREEMEAELVAKLAVMGEAIEAVGLLKYGHPELVQWTECRWCHRTSMGSVAEHYEDCQRQNALSAAPEVMWSGKAMVEGNWNLYLGAEGQEAVKGHRQVTVYVLAREE